MRDTQKSRVKGIEEHLSVISVMLLKHLLNYFEELSSKQSALFRVFMIVEAGSRRLELPDIHLVFLHVRVPEFLFLSGFMGRGFTRELLQKVNIRYSMKTKFS